MANFKAARYKAGLSVSQVAKALNVSEQAVCFWESGQYLPEARRLPDIATLYGVTVDELLKENPRP